MNDAQLLSDRVRDLSLNRQLTDVMRSAVAEKPRAEGETEAQYAATVFAAKLIGALRKAEEEQTAKQAAYVARQALLVANSRYWLEAPYLGLRTSVMPDEVQAFCDSAGLKNKDFLKFVNGEEPGAGDWSGRLERETGAGDWSGRLERETGARPRTCCRPLERNW